MPILVGVVVCLPKLPIRAERMPAPDIVVVVPKIMFSSPISYE